MLMHHLLVDAAERQPDKMAFRWVDRDRSLSYAAAVFEMDAFAGALAHLGVGKGDRVSIIAHNGLDYLLALFGCWRIGAIPALVNVKFADRLDYYFADHTPMAVIYTHDIGVQVRAAAARSAGIRHLVCMDGPQERAHSLPDLLGARFAPPDDPRDETAIAHLAYTSGTTGQPKGACLCHEPTIRAARCIGERLGLTADDVSFGPSALSSSYQLVGNILPPLAVMAPFHVMGRWTRETGFDAMEAAGATVLVANPTFLEDVRAEAEKRGRVPSRLRFGMSGGGPVPSTLKKAWRDQMKLPLVESYGQSELGGFIALGRPELEPDDAKLMRVGQPLPDKEVRILTAENRVLGSGEIGEIALRGGFMWGYWGKPDKTKQTLQGGWLHSGDCGVIDRDGYVTMRGRYSELITIDGHTWFPRDVEEALCRQTGIAEAAVIGVTGVDGTVTPVAYVRSESAIDEVAVKQLLAKEVPLDISTLRIVALEALPMTPTGKIAKAELAQLRLEA